MVFRSWKLCKKDINMFFIHSTCTCLRKTNILSQPFPYFAAWLPLAVVGVRAGVSCRSCPPLHGSPWPKQPEGPALSSAQQLSARLELTKYETGNRWNESHIFFGSVFGLNIMLKRVFLQSQQRVFTILGLQVSHHKVTGDLIRPFSDAEQLWY